MIPVIQFAHRFKTFKDVMNLRHQEGRVVRETIGVGIILFSFPDDGDSKYHVSNSPEITITIFFCQGFQRI